MIEITKSIITIQMSFSQLVPTSNLFSQCFCLLQWQFAVQYFSVLRHGHRFFWQDALQLHDTKMKIKEASAGMFMSGVYCWGKIGHLMVKLVR